MKEGSPMKASGRSGGKAGALALASLAVLALVVLGARQWQLRVELRTASGELAQAKQRAAEGTYNRLALPPNRKLTVCNVSGSDMTIASVGAVYMDSVGRPVTFNSASSQWRTWKIPAGATRSLDAAEAGGAGWDGSTVFYAMEIDGQGGSRLVSGTSGDLKSGCIRLDAVKGEDK
jgi:hypothetical protein